MQNLIKFLTSGKIWSNASSSFFNKDNGFIQYLNGFFFNLSFFKGFSSHLSFFKGFYSHLSFVKGFYSHFIGFSTKLGSFILRSKISALVKALLEKKGFKLSSNLQVTILFYKRV